MPNNLPTDDVHIAFCTCPDVGTAESLATALVEEGLAACVNLIPGLVSVYRWQGRTERDAEILLMIKTQRARLDAMTERLCQLHPYDVPEVIAHPVTDGNDAYLNWVRQCIDTTE
jgi:periplasmic divalent cation tolerance protein